MLARNVMPNFSTGWITNAVQYAFNFTEKYSAGTPREGIAKQLNNNGEKNDDDTHTRTHIHTIRTSESPALHLCTTRVNGCRLNCTDLGGLKAIGWKTGGVGPPSTSA